MSDPADASQALPSDPGAFQLRGSMPRVMRLSRKTLAVIGVAAGLSIGGALIYALQPARHPEAKELYGTGSRAASEAITSGPKDYGDVPKLGAPLPGDLGGPILAAQRRGENVSGPQPDPRMQAAEAARQRVEQERDAARTAGVFLGGGAGKAGSMPPGTVQTPASQAQSEQAAVTGQGDQAAKRAFLEKAADRRTVSAERLMAPVSPNILQAGSIIPAALITGIESDLPGQITAQVTANVYDSPTGRILLIPQGARLIGEYDSEVLFGQSRVLLAWDRLILPGGRSIVLDRQPGADATGRSGLRDRVNHHWGNVLKAALVSTLLGVGTELGSDSDDDLVRAVQRGTQDTANQAGQQIVQREMRVQPTITIRPGHPLRVIVIRDIVLEPVRQEELR